MITNELSALDGQINVFPNPVITDEFTFTYSGIVEKGSILELIDLNGRRVYSKQLDQHDNVHRIEHIRHFLEPGTYVLRFNNGSEVSSRQIMIR
jgi:methionine-rich copper-binding protein CopC